MITFLQTYGFWIFLIAMFILMTRMHGGHSGHGMGGCCGMGNMEHDHQDQSAHHQRSSDEPKSDNEQSYVLPSPGNEDDDRSRYNQPYQPYVRDLPAENIENSDDLPFVTTQQFRER